MPVTIRASDAVAVRTLRAGQHTDGTTAEAAGPKRRRAAVQINARPCARFRGRAVTEKAGADLHQNAAPAGTLAAGAGGT